VSEMKTATVVGAGMVGLATAWHLQERGVEVTVLDRHGVASGASWGNAGWLTPGMAMPLADPSLWAYGPKAMLDPSAALSVPFRFDGALWAFLARFMANATHGAWQRAMAALTPIDQTSQPPRPLAKCDATGCDEPIHAAHLCVDHWTDLYDNDRVTA